MFLLEWMGLKQPKRIVRPNSLVETPKHNCRDEGQCQDNGRRITWHNTNASILYRRKEAVIDENGKSNFYNFKLVTMKDNFYLPKLYFINDPTFDEVSPDESFREKGFKSERYHAQLLSCNSNM